MSLYVKSELWAMLKSVYCKDELLRSYVSSLFSLSFLRKLYLVSKNNFLDPKLNLPSKFAVLVQNASWPSKQWPVNKWQKLINYLMKSV